MKKRKSTMKRFFKLFDYETLNYLKIYFPQIIIFFFSKMRLL